MKQNKNKRNWKCVGFPLKRNDKKQNKRIKSK